MKVAVIGAGAAGCFCAIEIRRRHPDAQVCVFEAGHQPLVKVSLTGGGRCNLTNSFNRIQRLSEAYPRGEQLMKRALRRFSNEDVMKWFEKEGVRLTVQEDECVFPVSQDAMQIVRTLERLMRQLGVQLSCGRRVARISGGDPYKLEFADDSCELADKVVLSTGGASAASIRAMLPDDVPVTDTAPSLYTFKISDASLRSLMGAVVEDAALALAGTSFRSEGALLLTDWGVSGPATLRLSSYAARHLAASEYKGTLIVNWLNSKELEVVDRLHAMQRDNARKYVASTSPEELTSRVWKHLLSRAGVREDQRWAELGNKGFNKLVATLTADSYQITGRARFKEEFVTCGGVDLKGIDISTLECRTHPGLFFAGEVLDVDAITGGFNLQAAWSMAVVVADSI